MALVCFPQKIQRNLIPLPCNLSAFSQHSLLAFWHHFLLLASSSKYILKINSGGSILLLESVLKICRLSSEYKWLACSHTWAFIHAISHSRNVLILILCLSLDFMPENLVWIRMKMGWEGGALENYQYKAVCFLSVCFVSDHDSFNMASSPSTHTAMRSYSTAEYQHKAA